MTPKETLQEEWTKYCEKKDNIFSDEDDLNFFLSKLKDLIKTVEGMKKSSNVGFDLNAMNKGGSPYTLEVKDSKYNQAIDDIISKMKELL